MPMPSFVKIPPALAVSFAIIVSLLGGRAMAAPPAPLLLAPADTAPVQVPFTITWSAVTDPAGIVAYNWQVSPSPSFTPVVLINSTSGQTQSTVSGLAN